MEAVEEPIDNLRMLLEGGGALLIPFSLDGEALPRFAAPVCRR